MFCPLCKAEYRPGPTHCVDCGVSLVYSLAPLPPPAEAPQVLLFDGSNEAQFAIATAALRDAGIPFAESRTVPAFIYPSISQPRCRIWVREADQEAAERLLQDLFGPPPGQLPLMPFLVPDPRDSEESAGAAAKYPPEDWDPNLATLMVWTGDDPTFAQTLADSLRENAIGSRIASEKGPTRLFVHPEDEARAREIVREVVEATPPA